MDFQRLGQYLNFSRVETKGKTMSILFFKWGCWWWLRYRMLRFGFGLCGWRFCWFCWGGGRVSGLVVSRETKSILKMTNLIFNY